MTAEEFLTAIRRQYDAGDAERIARALDFATRAHAGQTRKSGEPYIEHPIAVAQRLRRMRLDADTIMAGLLHDVPEDTTATLADIEGTFGPTVAFLVGGITKVGKVKYRGLDRYIENLQKMFIAMAEDVRVVIIKFADRLHNLETLGALPKDKRHRIAQETIELYAPLAHRLGMGEIKGELEDLAFPYLNPREHLWISTQVGSQYHELERVVEELTWRVRERLAQEDLAPNDIHGRRKHLYSLYQKISRPENNRDLRRIYDLVALRIVMPNLGGCYAALGVVHRHWKPMPGRFKDYIAQPKPNGYRSLHTTIFGPNGVPVEIQIRDPQMHDQAEYGVTAHWHYTESGKPDDGSRVSPKLAWVRELTEWRRQVDTPEQYLEALRIDALHQRIFCFTPNGDVIDLPEGATIVDFAYHVHSDLGDRCVGARVNEKMCGVDATLKSGDVVEIVTEKRRKGPNPDWLDFVKTQAARSHIRRAARNQDSIRPTPSASRR